MPIFLLLATRLDPPQPPLKKGGARLELLPMFGKTVLLLTPHS